MSALLAALFGALMVLLVVAAYRAGRRISRDDGRLRLREVARARGLVLRSPESKAAIHADALAVRRCLACASQARCDRLAAARDWDALRELCPNSTYLRV